MARSKGEVKWGSKGKGVKQNHDAVFPFRSHFSFFCRYLKKRRGKHTTTDNTQSTEAKKPKGRSATQTHRKEEKNQHAVGEQVSSGGSEVLHKRRQRHSGTPQTAESLHRCGNGGKRGR